MFFQFPPFPNPFQQAQGFPNGFSGPGYGAGPGNPYNTGFGGNFSPGAPGFDPNDHAARMHVVAMAAAVRAQIEMLRAYGEMLDAQKKQVETGITSLEDVLRRWEERAGAEPLSPGDPSASSPTK